MIVALNGCVINKQIEYLFPQKVEQKITDYINQDLDRDYYIIMDKNNISEYYLSIYRKIEKESGITKILLTKNNRVVIINGKKIPIINLTDVAFYNLGKDSRGRIKRTSILGHGYGLYFNYNGDIIKEIK